MTAHDAFVIGIAVLLAWSPIIAWPAIPRGLALLARALGARFRGRPRAGARTSLRRRQLIAYAQTPGRGRLRVYLDPPAGESPRSGCRHDADWPGLESDPSTA